MERLARIFTPLRSGFKRQIAGNHFPLRWNDVVNLDRSRKKVCYTTDFVNMKEDVNCELLINQLTPAYPIIKEKVEWSEFERKYIDQLDQIYESFDEILAIRTDGVMFRSQLCSRLPSTISNKEQLDHIQIHSLDELKVSEEELNERRIENEQSIYLEIQNKNEKK